MVKHSKQRDAILANLRGRYDHPTAETVYLALKEEFPNLSLGTVYRNLTLLAELGEIQKISSSNGPDRFDGNAAPHYHFFCKKCNSVIDFDHNIDEETLRKANDSFDGEIQGFVVEFYGFCPNCIGL